MARKSTPSPAETTPETTDSPFVKRPELIDRVVEKSGMKKKDVKPAVEAALAVLADALEAEEELNLPPLGKLKVVRRKASENADILVCRLRRSHAMINAASGAGSDEKD